MKFLHVAAVTPILPIILFCQFQITNIPVSFNHEAGHEDPTSRLLRLQCASLCLLAVFNYDIDHEDPYIIMGISVSSNPEAGHEDPTSVRFFWMLPCPTDHFCST